MPHPKWLVTLVATLVAACGSPAPIKVQSQLVRDAAQESWNLDPMIRNEKLRRLHGAVTNEELAGRLGHYYTIRWRNRDVAKGPATLTFEYQQVATASEIKTIRKELPENATSGVVEIEVTGEDYRQGGRVLAWRITLRRGDETVATRQSYLWQ